MNEMEGRRKGCCVRRKGFASVYFLALLLAVSACCGTAVLNDMRRIRTMMFLEVNQRFFRQEMAVITDLKCRLKRDEWEDGVYDTELCDYEAFRTGTRISIYIGGGLPEVIIAETDGEGRILTDFEAQRDQTVIDAYLH